MSELLLKVAGCVLMAKRDLKKLINTQKNMKAVRGMANFARAN